MLSTRLWMGAILVILAVGVLLVDEWLAPWFPFLFLLLLGLAEFACFELLQLLPETRRPSPWLCHVFLLLLTAANWIVHLAPSVLAADPWHGVLALLTTVLLVAFLVEMANFREAGESIVRIALTFWVVAYLGLFSSFLAQLRWTEARNSVSALAAGSVCLALAIFVPKCCDIGAYFTGRLFGRHAMAPVLSPKKTWEGAFGGVLLGVAAAIAIDHLGPVLAHGLLAEIGFGVTVGIAGILGDLAESLIKRDCQRKDASQAVPGFGGVLDVIDAVLFAAPVSYWWLH